jgi:hypothetical protein
MVVVVVVAVAVAVAAAAAAAVAVVVVVEGRAYRHPPYAIVTYRQVHRV